MDIQILFFGRPKDFLDVQKFLDIQNIYLDVQFFFSTSGGSNGEVTGSNAADDDIDATSQNTGDGGYVGSTSKRGRVNALQVG